MKRFGMWAWATPIALLSAAAIAQSQGTGHAHDMAMCKEMQGMTGMHQMPGKVKAVDTKTGVVDVDAGGMALKLHFPANAVANMKAGDSINVHMGFMKS